MCHVVTKAESNRRLDRPRHCDWWRERLNLALALGFRAKANVHRFQFGQYLGIPLEAFDFFPRTRDPSKGVVLSLGSWPHLINRGCNSRICENGGFRRMVIGRW